MAHHKRYRPKKQRAGCGLCKPHKKWPKSGDENPPRERRKMQEDDR